MRKRSIARRLLVSVLLIQVVSALAIVGATLAYERHTRFQAFDMMLRGRADSLLGAVQDADDATDDVVLDRSGLSVPEHDLFEVRGPSGRVLGRSDNWGGFERNSPSETSYGTFRARVNGQDYRLVHRQGVRVVDPGKPDGGTVRPVDIIYGSPTAGLWSEIREAVAFYAGVSCLLLVLTGSLVFWQLRRGLQPLQELAAEAEWISAEQWTFEAPVSARSTTELAPLADALGSALKRLERSFEQQRHFVSDAAHELKTAVAVIKSSLQLLEMRSRTAEEYAAGLDRSLADCDRLEEIVAKMLTLARLEAGAVEQSHGAVTDLLAVASEAITELQAFAEVRRLRVTLASSDPTLVNLGREETHLLCSNLLLNALQHSGAGTEVALSIRMASARFVEFRVRDEGEGIDPAVLPFVFERFYRGDPSRGRKTGGTGLGLAICRAIAISAGGRIHLESKQGVGTVAVVQLPIGVCALSLAERLPASTAASSSEIKHLLGDYVRRET